MLKNNTFEKKPKKCDDITSLSNSYSPVAMKTNLFLKKVIFLVKGQENTNIQKTTERESFFVV